jgi:integrase
VLDAVIDGKSEQDAAVERVVHTDELTARDRAAVLIIVFGQHIEDVIQLTWNDVTVTDDAVTVRPGKTEFALLSPLDEPMRQLAAAPGNDLTASHPNSNWVFRGYSPGRHIHGSSLRSRLKTIFSTRAARLGTLHELTKLGPVPIIAGALGYHPSTIERHAIGSASTTLSTST